MPSTADVPDACAFARGALHHYYSDDPHAVGLIEPNTNLTTADLLATAIEELLDHLDPDGPRPWLRNQPGPADPTATITMTGDWEPQPWRPRFPGRRGQR
jgi:hypothetical protein